MTIREGMNVILYQNTSHHYNYYPPYGRLAKGELRRYYVTWVSRNGREAKIYMYDTRGRRLSHSYYVPSADLRPDFPENFDWSVYL